MSTRHEIAGELRVTTIFPGYTATNFASRVRKEDLRAQLEKSGEAFAMPPEAVAAAIAHAIDQPDGLNVAEIVMRSTGQPEEDARRLGCCSTNMLLYQHDERSDPSTSRWVCQRHAPEGHGRSASARSWRPHLGSRNRPRHSADPV